MEISDQIEPVDIDQLWQTVQDIAMRLARIRQRRVLSMLFDAEFTDWIDLQRKDLSDGIAELERDTRSRPDSSWRAIAEDLSNRTLVLENQKKSAWFIKDAMDDMGLGMKAASSARSSGDAISLSNTVENLEAAIIDLDVRCDELLSGIDEAKISKAFASAKQGDRPIQKVLLTAGNKMPRNTQPRMDMRDAVLPYEQEVVPQQRVAKATQTLHGDKLRKVMGRSLTDIEIEHVTRQFFKSVWEAGIDQKHVSDILFFTPKNCFGMSVHDALGYANGPDLLRNSFTEFRVNFSA